MAGRLKDKVAIVIGMARGIGAGRSRGRCRSGAWSGERTTEDGEPGGRAEYAEYAERWDSAVRFGGCSGRAGREDRSVEVVNR